VGYALLVVALLPLRFLLSLEAEAVEINMVAVVVLVVIEQMPL
jgi:hypothetical protein